MRKTIQLLLVTVIILVIAGTMTSNAQNGSIDGYISSGGSSVYDATGFTGSIAEPTIGLLTQDWQHLLQGFAYKTLDKKIVTSATDLASLSVKVKVFPNPVEQFLNIQYEGVFTGNEKYSINDITGRVVLSGKLTDPLTKLNVQAFRPGPHVFLILNTTTKQIIYCSKFVKLK